MNYSQEVAEKLIPSGINSLVDAFELSCEKHSRDIALSCLGHELTFGELDDLSNRFAHYLINDLELKFGDRIAIQLPNISQYAIVVWGVWRAGMVVVNTNPMYTPRELTHQFNDSEATALVVLDKLVPMANQVLPNTEIKHLISVRVSDLSEIESSSTVANDDKSDSIISFAETILKPATDKVRVSLTMDDLAALQYTGGTTGPSKGAMLSHGNIFCGRVMARESVVLSEPGSTEILIAVLPVYHVFGFTQNIIGAVLHGSMSVMIPDPRNLDSIINAMKIYPFTNMAGVNTLLSSLMAHPEFDEIDFSNITGVIVGGTALVKEIGDAWEKRTQTKIYEGYGLSETCANCSCNRPESFEAGTVGPSLNYQQIKLIDDLGNTVNDGERGEICIRGPNIMQGYWRNPEATDESIDTDGWFKTGDVGIVNERGHLKIVDRIKDMIIVSGFNVYPNEVEAVIYGHPNVVECAVIGVADDVTAEAIKLFVVSNSDALTSDAIIEFCRKELTAYKVPKQIVFKDDLPKSPAGKILRRELREVAGD
jgi:long-chain acyl-CoA synthetase